MKKIREAAVSGTFYPADKDQLKQMMEHYIYEPSKQNIVPKIIIAPHAGYIYSGSITGAVYARLIPKKQSIRRVLIMGPSHRVGFRGLALSSAVFFSTPLGDIELDTESVKQLSQLAYIKYLDQAHELEHSIEVHLPFLQSVLKQFILIPIVCGDASAEQVCNVIEQFYDQPDTLIVISSDLSHFHNDETAKIMDRKTSELIEQLKFEDLSSQSACGYIPLSGLMALARKKGLKIKTIDLKNSADTAGIGDKNRVVGYGTYVIE